MTKQPAILDRGKQVGKTSITKILDGFHRLKVKMEEKRGGGRSKRHASKAALDHEGYWDCSVCTYKNSAEAYKCEMCDVRKGTSTRKPRINTQMVQQQVAQQFAPPPKKEKTLIKRETSSLNGAVKNTGRSPKLKNIDHSSQQQMAVTVGNVTVLITDYKFKKRSSEQRDSLESEHNANAEHSDSSSSSSSTDHNDDSSNTDSNL